MLNQLLDNIRGVVRRGMRSVAIALDKISGGTITPNIITWTGLIAHIGIALLIATAHPLWAALLLAVFGLFDTLDGELARLQKRDNAAGMLLDATTDRLKEVVLYIGVAYFFVAANRPFLAVWATAAGGLSVCVSYVKAKGETAVSVKKLNANAINRLFQDGLARFEVRMALLLLGLISGLLGLATTVIAVLAVFTTIERLLKITRQLS